MKNNFVTVLNGISGAMCEMASTFQYAQAPTGIQNPFSSTMCGHIIAKKYRKNGSKNF
jgi:hypothetical protein